MPEEAIMAELSRVSVETLAKMFADKLNMGHIELACRDFYAKDATFLTKDLMVQGREKIIEHHTEKFQLRQRFPATLRVELIKFDAGRPSEGGRYEATMAWAVFRYTVRSSSGNTAVAGTAFTVFEIEDDDVVATALAIF
jgi:hypothetical protein